MNNHKRSHHLFNVEYERLCILQDLCQLSNVTANLKENFIDVSVDKIRVNEWNAILDALKVNNSLRYIALRSYWCPVNPDEKKRRGQCKKTPAIRSRDTTLKLAKSLKDCLSVSKSLECLVIQNLPLRDQDVRLLAKGISKSICLKYISLEQCCIGDEYFELLVAGIKTSQSLLSVNFSGCNLTWKSAEQIAIIIKYQASQRHGEAWQDSLRYRRPDLDRMHGLRRITLCDNMIGDNGCRILADAIKDDLWLKALDLQNCSISSDGAMILKESLCFNRSLWVLDLRRNQLLAYDLLRSIIEQVMINAGGEHVEYPWISSKETRDKTKNKKNSSKKNQIRSGKIRRKESMDSSSRSLHYSKSVHYPWRTGERVKANRYKSKNPMENDINEISKSVAKTEKEERASFNSKLMQRAPTHHKDEHPDVEKILPSERNSDYDKERYLEVIKKLKVEVCFYKHKYNDEKELRGVADEKIFELEAEKKKLEEELENLKSTISKEEEKNEPLKLPDLNKCGLDDDHVLDGIEASFERFQQFLDMLENLGLGDLYSQMQLLQQPCKENDLPPTST